MTPGPAAQASIRATPTPAAMRLGTTLVELLLVLALAGLLLAIAVPGIAYARDRAAVQGATASLAGTLAGARLEATRRQRRTAVRFDTVAARLVVHAGGDTVGRLPLGALFRVALSASRDSITFGATGLGVGAANVRVIVRRGAAADTVFVARTGRIRR